MRVMILFMCALLFSQEEDTTMVDTSKIEDIELPGDSLEGEQFNKTTTDTGKVESLEFPEVNLEREKPDQLPIGETFFDYKDDFNNLQIQIDSLKRVIRVMERKKAIPAINEELLNLIKIPDIQHRIELTNGTVVVGEIIEETDNKVIIQTTIGQLFLDKDKVVKIDEELPPAPKVELINEPFVSVFPNREEIRGVVKNVGKTRADFVRIIGKLWTAETELAYIDSVFAKGTTQEYNTGVITDTAIEPGATADFHLIIPVEEGENSVEYRTYDIHWTTTD
ncbi:MAG: hypothetical protein ACE5D0_08040 [Fidelibacterota bacterium]